MTKKPLKLLLAAPRGFCAGVDRAIQCVEMALHKYGSPVYVRHEIVHNKYVVENLRAKGAIFVEELDEIPAVDKGRPVIFSAHGVPKSVPAEAESKNMFYIDATCPLVSKVHREAERHHKNGKTIILIGHRGHPEVIGTIGQLPDGAVYLVETIEDVEALRFQQEEQLAYCTQTTLSVDDTAAIIAALNEKYPNIEPPHKEDICYATTNRQGAVKAIAGQAQAMIVIGAPNSSNANRLVEVALNHGSHKADLVQRAVEIEWAAYEVFDVVGITAGASTPEILVEEVIESAAAHFDISVEEVSITSENVVFNIPKVLRDEAA